MTNEGCHYFYTFSLCGLSVSLLHEIVFNCDNLKNDCLNIMCFLKKILKNIRELSLFTNSLANKTQLILALETVENVRDNELNIIRLFLNVLISDNAL